MPYRITDPYVKHHGSLGSFGAIYVTQSVETSEIIRSLCSIAGIQLAVEKNEACQLFDLPADRTGDIVVCADRHTVLGTHPDQHDLTAISRPLRSHGGLAERIVPIIFSQPVMRKREVWKLKNYDAFWLGLNVLQTTKEM
jgi:phosphonoacetate hydrolase